MSAANPKAPLALIIEDEPSLSDIYALAAEAAEFSARPFLDGNEALAALKTLVPAIVVLDLHLPGASGEQILNFIRSEKRLASTKVILITADVGMAAILDAATDLTLLKPVSYHQLRDLAKRLRADV